MSIRPVKRIVASKPTIEGAGVKLRRAFGFGDTGEFDPFLLFDDFRNDRPDDYLRRLPVASAPRHRDHHLRARRHGRARRQPRQPRHARRRRRAVDDGRQRHHPPGDAEGRRRTGRMHGFQLWANLPSVAQDDRRRATRTSPARDIPEVIDDDGTRVRVDLRRLLGQARAGRRHRRRSALSRRLGAAGHAQDAAGRDRRATPSPTCSRAPGRFRDASAPLGVLTERRRRRGERLTARATGNRSLVLFDRGDEVDRAGRRRGHPLPARLGQAARGAGRLVRADRDEHPGRAARRPSPSCATGTFIRHA